MFILFIIYNICCAVFSRLATSMLAMKMADNSSIDITSLTKESFVKKPRK